MYLPKQGSMALDEAHFSKLRCANSDNNNITDEGCEHLSKAQWQKLKDFYISSPPKNRIKLFFPTWITTIV